jgi:hypothetical protein
LLIAPELHGGDDVSDPGAACDQRRTPVDHRIMDLAGLVVALVGGPEHFATKTRCEILDCHLIKGEPPSCDRLLLGHQLPPFPGGNLPPPCNNYYDQWQKIRKLSSIGSCCLYSTDCLCRSIFWKTRDLSMNCREGVFSETGLPVYQLLVTSGLLGKIPDQGEKAFPFSRECSLDRVQEDTVDPPKRGGPFCRLRN